LYNGTHTTLSIEDSKKVSPIVFDHLFMLDIKCIDNNKSLVQKS
jgi:hypothetical protein